MQTYYLSLLVTFLFLLSPLLFILPLLFAVKVSTEVSWILPRVLVV